MVIFEVDSARFASTVSFASTAVTGLSLFDVIIIAISATRLARPPPAKATDGRRDAAPRCFVDEGGRLAERFALIANNGVEYRTPRESLRFVLRVIRH